MRTNASSTDAVTAIPLNDATMILSGILHIVRLILAMPQGNSDAIIMAI